MKKTLVAFLLVATMLVTLALPSFAAETDLGDFGAYVDLDFDSADDISGAEVNDTEGTTGITHSVADGALKFVAAQQSSGQIRYEIKIPVGGEDGVEVDTTKTFSISFRFRMANVGPAFFSYDSDLSTTPANGLTTHGDGLGQVNNGGTFCVTQNGGSGLISSMKNEEWHTVDILLTPFADAGTNDAHRGWCNFVAYVDGNEVYDSTKHENKGPLNLLLTHHGYDGKEAKTVKYVRINFGAVSAYDPTAKQATLELDYFRIGNRTAMEEEVPENSNTSDFTAAAVVLVAIATAGVVYTKKRR